VGGNVSGRVRSSQFRQALGRLGLGHTPAGSTNGDMVQIITGLQFRYLAILNQPVLEEGPHA
jgi:hypothetical protein